MAIPAGRRNVPSMELRHLRYFRAVAEQLNFSRAAEQLHVAQPALSRQIRALEEELGTTLLDRNHARVHLTDAGRTFYSHTCKILAQVDIATASVREVGEGAAGELIVCNDWHLGGPLVPAALNEFRQKFPRAEVVLHDRKLQDQLALVCDRRVHLGFAVRELIGGRRELEQLLLFRSDLVVVFPPNHPMSGRKKVRLAELAEETWISVDRRESPQYVAYLNRLCRLSGFTPKLGPVATTLEGILGRVASGYGVVLLPEYTVPPLQDQLDWAVSDCEPIELCAVWHRQEKSRLLQEFVQVLGRHAKANLGARPKTPAAR